MDLAQHIPAAWRELLKSECAQPYWNELQTFLSEEFQNQTIFPPIADVFSALALTPYEQVKVLILGQDPYHDDNQAHGLCFSVRPGVGVPPSLRNIYKELQTDIGFTPPNHGYLTHWAKQGVLMLNAVLTVRAHSPNSHKDKGWEKFTDAIIRKLNELSTPVVFILWGGYARKKAKLIKSKHHTILAAAHPSPLSAHSGFFGSKPFSATNAALSAAGLKPIQWQLPADPGAA